MGKCGPRRGSGGGATARGRAAGSRGFALPVVLVLVAAMAAVAVGLIDRSRDFATMASARAEELVVRQAANGGIAFVLALAARGVDPLVAAPAALRIGDTEVAVRVESEVGKLDLNVGSSILVQGLFDQAGVEPVRARSLVAQVEQDRRREPPRVFHGVDELMRLDGMDLDALERVRPHVTVFGASPGINSTVAALPVLMAVPGMTPDLARAVVLGRSGATGTPPAAASLLRLYEAAGRPVYRVVATARLGDRAAFARAAIVDLSEPRRPLVLGWERTWEATAGTGGAAGG